MVITAECIVNGQPHYSGTPSLELFTPATLDELLQSSPLAAPVEAMDYSVSAATLGAPHIVMELEGRQFTSAAVFLRRVG